MFFIPYLPLLLCLGLVNGFYPNHESGGGIAPSDYTDTEITEMGVLQAVARFMEKNPPPGKLPMAPGTLENMESLTATRLFKAYYQADVSAIRFAQAIQDLVNGNNEVERFHGQDKKYFFSCEAIAQGINLLRSLQTSVVSSLKGTVNSTTLASARQKVGEILHVLQQFYSNTNWVEMGKSETYKHLLDASSPAFSVAPTSKQTCSECSRNPSGLYQCDSNILVNDMLTSGYKLSATCPRKLRGKCGHGGNNDPTQNFPVRGGINKETSNPELSPHYLLHTQAAKLAIEATRDFFVGDGYGLLSQVGNDTFRKFFSLEGYSLTFVIDTTGSMSDDIKHVKATCIDIIRGYSGSSDAPFNFVLVPFNDPDVGPVRKTKSVEEFESYITELVVTGGGDCPEMSLTGLKLALQESLPRSKIFTFTDAGAKDKDLEDEVKVLIDSSGSEVSSYLTGYCSSRKRRSLPEEPGIIYANVYEELAAYSGGYYVLTSKGNLPQVLSLMDLSLNAAPVKVAHRHVEGTQLTFPVDENLSEITISVKQLGRSPFTITLLQPSGTPPASAVSVINTVQHKVLKVSPITERGSWTVVMSPSGSYEVEIGGKSLLDFTFQIMQRQEDYVLPIQGRPVKGSNYIVSVKIMSDTKGAQVLRLIPLSGQGKPIEVIKLNQTFDALGNSLAIAPISLNKPNILLSVEGLSPGNLPFSRVSANPISTESVQIVPLPDQKSTMSPGDSLNISVAVINEGSGARFSIKVWDDLGLLSSFRPTEIYLNPGENATIMATFTSSADSSNFSSSMATFTAESSTAQNYLKLPINIIPETALETDEISPVHKILDFIIPCIGNFQRKPACSQRIWRLRFSAKDTHSAVTVRANPNPSGLVCKPREADVKDVICFYEYPDVSQVSACCSLYFFTHLVDIQVFARGTITRKPSRQRSDCCSPYAEILISDENGNTDILTIDRRRPHLAVA